MTEFHLNRCKTCDPLHKNLMGIAKSIDPGHSVQSAQADYG